MITEANESNPSKQVALMNLMGQVMGKETMGVIQMYEDAAISAGATVREVEDIYQRCKS
jgi:hypothetical protein